VRVGQKLLNLISAAMQTEPWQPCNTIRGDWWKHTRRIRDRRAIDHVFDIRSKKRSTAEASLRTTASRLALSLTEPTRS
jgi:hypothetical protein